MATDGRAALAGALEGLGGAPARPGVVHVVGGGRRDVGQGPSDPAILTLRAAVLAGTVDHLVVDPRASRDLVALARPDATVTERDPGELGGDLPAGSVLVVLADDPSERGGALVAEAVREAGREVEVVPAIGLVRAATTAAGVALPPAAWGGGALEEPQVVAVESGDLAGLAERLAADRVAPETPALVISWAGRPRQRVAATTVGQLGGCVERGGTVVVLGTASGVPWRDDLPLAGVSVLVPRARHQASALSMRIRSLGGEAIEAATITIEPGDGAALEAAVRELADGAFTAVCLTSPNGVDALVGALDAAGLDARALAAVGIVACVGPGTAGRLWERLHVRADLVPEVSTSAALAEAFPPGAGRVLLPRADIATTMLHDGLRAKGYDPVEVTAYVTGTPDGLPEDVLTRLAAGDVDLLAFASSSTARNFATLVGTHPWSGDVVSIGPVTSATCAELGIPVAAEADPHDLDGLVAALCRIAPRPR